MLSIHNTNAVDYEDESALMKLVKNMFKINTNLANMEEWRPRIARITEEALNLVDLPYRKDKELPLAEITVGNIVLVLRHIANKASNKRPKDGGLSELELAKKLRKDDEFYYLRAQTLIGCFAVHAANEAIDAANLDEKISNAYDRGNEERAAQLEEYQNETQAVYEEIGWRVAENLIDGMKDAIIDNDDVKMADIVHDGRFQIDI